MPKYKFSDIAENITEKGIPSPGDETMYIGLEHLDSGSLKISRWGSDVPLKGQKLIMRQGDILFGRRNTYLRRAAIAPHDGFFSAHGMIFRPRQEVIDPVFFPFFISSSYFMDEAIRISVGSLSPTVNWKTLKELEFVLPEMDEQRELAGILSAANEAKEAYKELLRLTDELVKSQFIEMFGNPYTNPMGWPARTILEVMRGKVSNGFFAKPADYCEDGNAGIVCVGDVVNRKYSNVFGLRRANATAEDFARYSLKYGDSLFCRSSLVKEGIGKASIVPENTEDSILFECHVIRVPLDLDIIIPEFFQALTASDYFREQMISKSKTATMTTIGQKDIVSTKIFVPPIDLQRQFKEFSRQSDKSKLELKQSIDSISGLIRSLMQQAFSD